MDFFDTLILAWFVYSAFKKVSKRLDVIEKKLGIEPEEVKSNW